MFRREEDFNAGRWLKFVRYYNSDPSAGTGPLGARWSYTYSDHITYVAGATAGTGTATVTRDDGRISTYTLSSGSWAGEPDIFDALTWQTDSSGHPTGWTLQRVDDRSVEQFDASGHLVSIQDPEGFTTVLTYSTAATPTTIAPGPGYLITVTDPQQRTMQLAYDGSGRIAHLTTPGGAVYGYAYDGAGNLATVTFPGGVARTYLYNEAANVGGATTPALLTGILDEAGQRFVSYSYNAAGKAINNQLAGGVASYTVTYNSDGSADVLDPLGTARHHTFSTIFGVPRGTGVNGVCQSCSTVSTWTYDFNGLVNQTTDDNGNVTTYYHDGDGMETGRTEGSGSTAQRSIQTDWNDTFHVPTERRWFNASAGLVTKTDWIYNTQGQATAECRYNPMVSGATSYACSASGTVPAGVRRWTYTYCTAVDGTQCPIVGLLLSATGPRTDIVQTTSYSYYLDSATSGCPTPGGACHQPGDLHTVTDPLGQVTTVASYDADGRPTRITDANGINTDLTYTPRGWLASRTVGGATTTFGYTPYGAVSSVTDPDGVTTTYGYDAAHRLVKVTDAQGNYVQYTLDAAGDKTAKQVFDSNGTVHQSLSRTFNALGELTTVVDGLNHTVFNASAVGSYDANGNLVQSSDGLGIQRQQSYDALNRLVQTIDNYNGTN